MKAMNPLDVELLVVADCPHEVAAAALLRRALDDVGLTSTRFDIRVIADLSEAEQAAFSGSPTILINGADPLKRPDSQPGLACRIYRSGAGTSPVPDLGPLRQALRRAIDR
jgi:hypothetical protein